MTTTTKTDVTETLKEPATSSPTSKHTSEELASIVNSIYHGPTIKYIYCVKLTAGELFEATGYKKEEEEDTDIYVSGEDRVNLDEWHYLDGGIDDDITITDSLTPTPHPPYYLHNYYYYVGVSTGTTPLDHAHHHYTGIFDISSIEHLNKKWEEIIKKYPLMIDKGDPKLYMEIYDGR